MSIVNFTSGINNIENYASLSEWAVNYIFAHKLTRENHANSEYFRSLPRRQKDAVRYQLRKSTSLLQKEQPKKSFTMKATKYKFVAIPKLKIALSIWISCFLLVDIVQIYTAKGLSPFLAWQTAILVELCIFAGSLCKEKRIQKTAYAFLVYNMCLFAFSEANEIIKKLELNKTIIRSINEKLDSKNKLTAELEDALQFQKQTRRELSKFIGQGYISSASQAAVRLDKSFIKKERESKAGLDTIEVEINDLEIQRNNILLIGIVALLYFSLRCMLQIFSVWLLRSS